MSIVNSCLYTKLVSVNNPGNREDLLKALSELGEFDNDFNGKNGYEYNWEETNNGGFDSNLDYLLNVVKDIKLDRQCVLTFINYWMSKERGYYADYNISCLTDHYDRVYAISFVTLVKY